MEDVNHYEEYLGDQRIQETEMIRSWDGNNTSNPPDQEDQSGFKIPMRGGGPVSTVVCNHIGWFDIMGLICTPLHPGFTPKIELFNTPLVGSLAAGIQSLFVDRAAGEGQKDAICEQIAER